MKLRVFLPLAATAVLALAPAQAQPAGDNPGVPDKPEVPAIDPSIQTRFIRLAPGVLAVLYEPKQPGPKSRIAVFAMHSNADYLAFSACTELSKRGYRVLCANNSIGKGGNFDEGQLDRIILEAKLGVLYLRGLPGVEKVVLFGHSGGATLMSAYQMIAEQGVKACQGPEKVFRCADALAGLPRADGFMAIDSNWGQASMALFSIDPAVTDESTGLKTDPSLDLFDPKNGFKPDGAAYSPDFIRRFQQAQGARNNRLIGQAQARLRAIANGRGLFQDDEPLTIPGASLLGANNKLYPQDPRLLSHSKRPWPLLKANGSTSVQIVHSVRRPMNRQSFTGLYRRGALKTTVRGYLNTYAVRVTPDFGYGEDGVRGIDWNSSYAVTPGNVAGITVPTLAMGMTGSWEYLAAEVIYERSASPDKSIAFVEGATHLYTPCKACERVPGEFGDTIRTTYDHIDHWLAKPGRFLP